MKPARIFSRTSDRLALALLFSLLAHLALALPDLLPPPRPAPPPPPLLARLQAPPAPATVPLTLPEPEPAVSAPPARPAAAKPAKRPPEKARHDWQQEIRRQFKEQEQRGEFYPPEAIALGLEGEVLVRLLLTPDGSVSAARVEQSSGHPLLDAAALRAVRALRALPADAPRETLLPVRFRLD